MQSGLCPICDQRPTDHPEPLTVELQFRSSITTQPRIRVELGRNPQSPSSPPRPAAVAVLTCVCVLLFTAAVLAFRNPDLKRGGAQAITAAPMQARVQTCMDATNDLRAKSDTATQNRAVGACESALDALEASLIAQQSPDDQRSLQLNVVNVRAALLLAYTRSGDVEQAKAKAREILDDVKNLKASDFPPAKTATAGRIIDDARALAEGVAKS